MRRRLIIKRRLVRQRRLNAVSRGTDVKCIFPATRQPVFADEAPVTFKGCQSGINHDCQEY
jgi:hypothetical protein